MRNNPSIADPCHSLEPGHRLDLRSGAGHPIRSENWVPARIRVVMEYRVGMVVMVWVEGIRQRYFAHDLFAIRRLLQPARAIEPGAFGALFNERSLVIALPVAETEARHGRSSPDRDMACFSVSPKPLSPCILHRDEALAREFARVTAGLRSG